MFCNQTGAARVPFSGRVKGSRTERPPSWEVGGGGGGAFANSLGVPSPFFPGILLFRKPSQTQGKLSVFEKNDGGESTPRNTPTLVQLRTPEPNCCADLSGVAPHAGIAQYHGVVVKYWFGKRTQVAVHAPAWKVLCCTSSCHGKTFSETPLKLNATASKRIPG